jgi:DNA-binding transcriptional ArsR family regulator
MTKIDYEFNAQIFKALSHPVRLQMIALLAEDECCVTEVMATLKISQSMTSQHLLILKNSGIIYPEKHGTKTCYKVNNELSRDIIGLLKR